MANKKINELSTRTPSLSDLMLVGDPSSGYSYKCTITSLATIIETDIADGYVTLGTTQTITGAKTFSNNLTLTSVSNAGVDTDKFLVLNGSNIVNFRTGSEVLSDIGGQGALTLTTTGTSGAATLVGNTLNIPQYQGAITLTTTGTSGAATLVGNTLNIPNYAPDLSGYVPTSRTITINGTTQDLTANRTYNVGTVTSVAASAGTGISISGSPITTSGTITITNTAPDQVVALTAGTGISVSGTYPNFTITNSSPSLGGTVTSVALSAPTGFAVTGSPITSSGTLALAFASGYSLPTTASQTNWNTAYDRSLTSISVSGTTTKTLTLNKQDGTTLTASWTDINTDAVTSVFGRTGAVVAANGDYTTAQVTESGNLYYTDARARASLSAGTGISYSSTTGVISSTITQYTDALARAAISLTTTGSSGAATYSNTTGVLNIPTYTLAGLGGITIASLSATAPLSYNNTTGVFSIALATASTDGYLRFQDWNFFADKIGGSGTTNYIPKFTSSSAIGNSNLINDASGNLGLGVTPNPWISGNLAFEILSASGLSSDGTSMRVQTNAYVNSAGNWIYKANGAASFYTTGAGSHAWYIAPSGTAGNAISFTQAMTLDASGRLGIGTTNPGNLLEIQGSAPRINIIGTNNGSNVGYRFQAKDAGGTTKSAGMYLQAQTGSTSYIGFSADDNNYQMIVNANGNVGIGTTNPNAILHTLSSSANAGIIATTSNTSLYTEYRYNSTTVAGYIGNGNGIVTGGGAGNFGVRAETDLLFAAGGNAERMRITSGGNVGINTQTPNATFHVNGSIASAISIKTATYTLTSSDYTVVFDLNGNATANLPNATTCSGRIYVIKINRTNVSDVLTIDPNGAQTIDGNATYDLQCQQAITIQSDGSNWRIIGDYAAGVNCL